MTESEAKTEIMESGIELGAGDYVDVEALKVAVNAIEEVQAYRAIGTIESFRELTENERKCEDCAGCTNWKCDFANIRNNAIDEFAERLKQYTYGRTNGIYVEIPLYKLDEIASQMKGEKE